MILLIIFLLQIHTKNPTLSTYIPKKIIIKKLFPIHQKNSKNQNIYNKININQKIQKTKTILFTINKINQNPKILPKITLNTKIYNTYTQKTYTLKHSLKFIHKSFTSINSSNFFYNNNTKTKTNHTFKNITNIINNSYNNISIQITNLLQLFKLPQINYTSTNTNLNNKTQYNYFSKTIPPNNFQTKTIINIIKFFN